jgi:multidrug efflux system membrane fusion protein
MNVTIDPQKSRKTAAPVQKRRSRFWLWLIIAAVLIGGIYYLVHRSREAAAAAAGTGTGRPGGGAGRGGFGGQRPPTFVSAEPARRGELRNYITALGTVTATNTATVRSRVDGELLKLHFEEGQRVKSGDLLAEIDPRSYEVALQQSEGQLARDRALLDNAKLDLQRYLSAREAVTQQQIDTAKAAVAQYEGAVKADEGSVANYKLQLSYCRVVAPIDGRVGLRQIDVGNLVRSGDTNGLLVITQDQPIAVLFSIPEDNLPSVRRALAAGESLPVEVYDRSMQNRLATGTLVAVDNQIDVTTGTVRLKATVPNEDLALFPNQFVNVRLLVSTDKNALLIPTTAVQISAQDRFAYVVDGDNVVQRKAIKVGNSEGSSTAVLDGLQAGDLVVTEGLDRLQNGTKVMMRPQTAPGAPNQNPNGASDKNGGQRRNRNREKGGAPAGKGP